MKPFNGAVIGASTTGHGVVREIVASEHNVGYLRHFFPTSFHRIARAWQKLLLSMLFTIAPLSAQAADISCHINDCTVIDITGEISRGDYDKLNGFFGGQGGQSIQTIGIDSPGGSIDEAMKIGRLLRNRERWVAVPENGECASACVLILAGGVRRYPLGRVGIHRPYFEELDPSVTSAGADQAYKAMFQEIRNYLSEMNVPTALAGC
jgi:hypothetical protein